MDASPTFRWFLIAVLLSAAAANAGGPPPAECTDHASRMYLRPGASCFLARLRADIQAARAVFPLSPLGCRSVLAPCGNADKDCNYLHAALGLTAGQDLGFGHRLHSTGSTYSWPAYERLWSFDILMKQDTILWAVIRWHDGYDSVHLDEECGAVPPTGSIEYLRDSNATLWIGNPALATDTLLRRLADIRDNSQVVYHGAATDRFDRVCHRLGARQLVALTHAMNVGTRIEALRYLLHHHTDRALIDPLRKSVGSAWARKESPPSVLQLLSREDLHWIARAMATTKTVMVLEEDVEGDVDALEYLLTPDGHPTSWQHRIMDGPDREP